MKRFFIACIICLMLLQGIGLVAADDTPDYSKIVIVHLNINQSGVTEKSVEMRYGHAPNLETRYGDFKGTLKSADGSTIREFDLWDPRYQLGMFLKKILNLLIIFPGTCHILILQILHSSFLTMKNW